MSIKYVHPLLKINYVINYGNQIEYNSSPLKKLLDNQHKQQVFGCFFENTKRHNQSNYNHHLAISAITHIIQCYDMRMPDLCPVYVTLCDWGRILGSLSVEKADVSGSGSVVSGSN